MSGHKIVLTIITHLSIIGGLSSQKYGDCSRPFPVCSKQTYHFDNLDGHGEHIDKLPKLRCSNEIFETNSIWLRWSVSKRGVLTFFIDPVDSENDIDFILFKMDDNDCESLEEVRCMTAGTTVGQKENFNYPCQGPTGLSYQSIDEFEASGCKYESDNFLKFLATEAGEDYILLINNFDSSKGISISFDGDLEFEKSNECLQFSQEQPITITEIVPNPTLNNIQLAYFSVQSSEILAEVFSLNGRLIWKSVLESKPGVNRHAIISEDYPAGTYLLRITQNEFSTIRQFIKL